MEFCERASYYGKLTTADVNDVFHFLQTGTDMYVTGCAQIWTNYINRPLPKGGNGFGAVPAGSQSTQGALGMGESIAVRFHIVLH